MTKGGVQIVPPPRPKPTQAGFGVMAGAVEELVDILEPLDGNEWQALG